MEKPKNLTELQEFINILEDLNDKQVYTNYASLRKDLLETFGIKLKREDYEKILEPTAEDLALDLEIQLRNVC